MKLIVLSDTHGNYPLALRAIDQAGKVDCVIHLGDEIEDAGIIELCAGQPVIKVPGNCDTTSTEPREVQRTLAGMKFLITHGDRYHVKAGLARLHRKALAEDVQIVLYGHTHVPSIERIDGIVFINPGYFDRGRNTGSYAVIGILTDTITAEIQTVAG